MLNKYLNFLTEGLFNKKLKIPPEIKKIIKKDIEGVVAECIMNSEKTMVDTKSYNIRYNLVDPNFVEFASFFCKNSKETWKLLPNSTFNERTGLAEGAHIAFYFNTKNNKIYWSKFNEGDGVTYNQRKILKESKKINYNNFTSIMKTVCNRGFKKPFWK